MTEPDAGVELVVCGAPAGVENEGGPRCPEKRKKGLGGEGIGRRKNWKKKELKEEGIERRRD